LAIANFDRQLKDKRFLAYMLFEGKVRYFAKKLLPEINDTLIFGYTNKQMAWCNESESQLWEYIIEKKLLYQKNPSEYMRFLTDGPFTSADGIPQESAPMIGVYTGYKIIENYADKSGASLEEIMNFCTKLYEKAYSALDILCLLENPKFLENKLTSEKRYELLICFNRVRKEFRNEKLLILFVLNFIFLSSELSLENISFM
jgi:hypothetical protein